MLNNRVKALMQAVNFETDDDGWVPPPLIPEEREVTEVDLERFDLFLTKLWHRN